jgi:ABC-type arginine transport system ATPase subunit
MTKKTIKRAKADVGMIFTAYNLRRIFNIIDKNLLQSYLKELALPFSYIIHLLNAILSLFVKRYFDQQKMYFLKA